LYRDAKLKQTNESLKDYKLRLCRNKDIYNITWDKIAELLSKELGYQVSESYARKWYSYYSEGYNDGLKAQNEEVFKEIEKQKLELQKEKIKLQSLRADYNSKIREQARFELLLDFIRDEIKNNNLNKPPENLKDIQPKVNKRSLWLLFADLHYDKIIRQKDVYPIKNEYDIDILKQRMWLLQDEVIKIAQKEGFNFINIANLGDVIDGILRVSQLQWIKLGIVESTIQVSAFLRDWLNELSKRLFINYYYVAGSNHSELRLLDGKKSQFANENMERIIGAFLEESLKNNPNVQIHNPINNNFNETTDLGFNILMLHGNNERNLDKIIHDYSQLHRKFYDYVFIGHSHSSLEKTVGAGEVNDIEIIRAPSICGIDNYAYKNKWNAKAGAKCLIFEEGKGKTISYDIKLN
jgi:predicted phosphodiesterase